MNKISLRAFFIFTLLSFISPIMAEYESSVELRCGAFFYTSERFREIYDAPAPDFQLEGSTPICGCLDCWVNFDWFSKTGESVGLDEKTRVRISNFSLGLKYRFELCDDYVLYLGIGPSLGRINIKNNTPCQDEHVSKLAIGGVLKSGVWCAITNCIFIDLFADYLYQPTEFDSHVDVGGFKLGAGIGYRF